MTAPCVTCTAPLIAIEAQVDPQTLDHRFVAQCGHPVSADVARAAWRDGMRWTLPVIDGAALVAAERVRQIHEEGYTPDHDARLGGELPWVAWALLDRAVNGRADDEEPPAMWPRSAEEWKAHEPIRALTIAAALIAAELDRQLTQRRQEGAQP